MSGNLVPGLSVALRVPPLSPQAVLIAAIAVMLAAFVWQGISLFSVWRGEEVNDARLAIRAAGGAGSGIGLEQVAKLHLFGEKADEPVAAAPVQTEMPQTDLKFVLVGAMTDGDASKASALITTDKQTSRFFVGDSIASGVVLQEVRADAVVLKRNGKLETLSFPRASESDVSVPGRGIGLRGGVGLQGGIRQERRAAPPVSRPLNMPANRFLHGGDHRSNARPAGTLPAHAGNE